MIGDFQGLLRRQAEYGLDIPTIRSPAEAQAFVDARIAEGSDWIKIATFDDRHQFVGLADFATETGGPVDFHADPVTGDLYYLAFFTGELRRIRSTASVSWRLLSERFTRSLFTYAPMAANQGRITVSAAICICDAAASAPG